MKVATDAQVGRWVGRRSLGTARRERSREKEMVLTYIRRWIGRFDLAALFQALAFFSYNPVYKSLIVQRQPWSCGE